MRLLLLFSVVLAGCAHNHHLIDKPFFYEISKGDKHGVILGTLRRGVSIDELPPVVTDAYRDADAFVTESEMGNYDLNDHFSTPDAQPLTRLLSPVEYKATVDWLNRGYTAETVRTILEDESPVGVAMRLARVRLRNDSYHEWRSLRFGQETTMEGQLHQSLAGRPIFYLSTERAHAKVHKCLAWSDAETLANIRSSLTGGNPLEADLQKAGALEDAYRSGDSQRVAEAAAAYKSPDVYACVVSDRNPDLAAEIDTAVSRYHAPFITVAIAHLETLPGVKSVRDLLIADGYTVTRVETERKRHAH